MVRTYEAFALRLNELGFLMFGGTRDVFLQLGMITEPAAWHRGDELDPWQWRRMLVERGDGVYARVLGGLNTLISNEWYPSFVAAYTPAQDIGERYARGEVDQTLYRLYALFDERPTWAKHEFSQALPGSTRSALERALTRMQTEMAITVSGESQRMSWDMKPIGWPSVEYERVDARMGRTAYERALERDAREARQMIRRRAAEIFPNGDRVSLDKLLRCDFSKWSDEMP